jgi:hypothetical protein
VPSGESRGMDGTANFDIRRRHPRAVGSSPQLECQSCRLPVLLGFVERDGDRRSIDCPYCGRHDEWTVMTGS